MSTLKYITQYYNLTPEILNEYINIIRFLLSGGNGHFVKECRNNEVCSKCMSEHKIRECNAAN